MADSRRPGVRPPRHPSFMDDPVAPAGMQTPRGVRPDRTLPSREHKLAGPAHRRDLAGVARLLGYAGQYGQHLAERGVDFDVGERVATGRAPVDDCHRDPRLPSPVHEAQP